MTVSGFNRLGGFILGIGLTVWFFLAMILPKAYELSEPAPVYSEYVTGPEDALNATVIIRCFDGGSGSGFHIGDGLIVTNAHVVLRGEHEQPVRVEGYSAEIEACDNDLDLALIRCDQVRHLKRFRISSVPVGLTYEVYCTGSQFGHQEAITKGFVSALRHDGTITTSPMNPGNSGGSDRLALPEHLPGQHGRRNRTGHPPGGAKVFSPRQPDNGFCHSWRHSGKTASSLHRDSIAGKRCGGKVDRNRRFYQSFRVFHPGGLEAPAFLSTPAH